MKAPVSKYSTAKAIRAALRLIGVPVAGIIIIKQVRRTRIIVPPNKAKEISAIMFNNKACAEDNGFGLFFYGAYDANDNLIGPPTSVAITVR